MYFVKLPLLQWAWASPDMVQWLFDNRDCGDRIMVILRPLVQPQARNGKDWDWNSSYREDSRTFLSPSRSICRFFPCPSIITIPKCHPDIKPSKLNITNYYQCKLKKIFTFSSMYKFLGIHIKRLLISFWRIRKKIKQNSYTKILPYSRIMKLAQNVLPYWEKTKEDGNNTVILK